MDLKLLSKYAQPVPRYTSYPTAPHFNREVDSVRYGAWLASLGDVGPLSLYFHIPFCRSLCWFCGCSTKVVNQAGPIERYFDLLLREITLVADRLNSRRRVGHIHLGGGTPTTLSARSLLRLAEAIRDRFDLMEDADFAIEVDPRVLTDEQAAALGTAGVNRASLGVQDFTPRVQKAINRIQTYEITARAVEMLRKNYIGRINLDLMYGLPYQTVDSVVATTESAVTLAPDRLALFGYAHVPWLKKYQRLLPEAALPGAAARVEQSDAAAKALSAHGYVAVGLDHFARADDALARAFRGGALNRNFQGYTTDGAEALIGFGASSIGSFPSGYAQNSSDVREYGEAIGRGDFATVRGFSLGDDDRMRREVIQRLMCYYEVDLEMLSQVHGRKPSSLDSALAILKPMAADGLVSFEGDWLRISQTGRPFVRTVCAAFDRYLAGNAGRHSSAV